MSRHVLASSVLFLSIGPACAQSGPWNLDALKKPPHVEWLDKDGTLRRLLYESEP
jgi:hypothetical protein